MGFWQWTNLVWAQPNFHYDTPGTYTVSLLTEVTELALTQVNITSLGGGWGQDIEDFFGAPDPYFVLSGPNGGIYTSAYADGNETPTLGGFSIPLDAGTTYNIAFYDSDGVITGDDFLGSSDFTPTGGGDLTVSNSTTAILTLTETVVASFNESTQPLWSLMASTCIKTWMAMGLATPMSPWMPATLTTRNPTPSMTKIATMAMPRSISTRLALVKTWTTTATVRSQELR